VLEGGAEPVDPRNFLFTSTPGERLSTTGAPTPIRYRRWPSTGVRPIAEHRRTLQPHEPQSAHSCRGPFVEAISKPMRRHQHHNASTPGPEAETAGMSPAPGPAAGERKKNDGGAGALGVLEHDHLQTVYVTPQANPQKNAPRVFGYKRFRGPQQEISKAPDRCGSALVLMPTEAKILFISCPPSSSGAAVFSR